MLRLPRRSVRLAALLIATSALLSGPVAMLVVTGFAPQPPWTDAATFSSHYEPLQALPYVLGFPLLFGFVLFVAACHTSAGARHRVRTSSAMIFTAVYAALVFTNYMLQVAYVPTLVAASSTLAAELTMANPSSVAWMLEMFGYGALGVAMWLVSPLFSGSAALSWVRVLLVVNAVMSIAGALFVTVYDAWVFSNAGLASFLAWNGVVIVSFGMLAALPSAQLPSLQTEDA